jgi:hypothetical protein
MAVVQYSSMGIGRDTGVLHRLTTTNQPTPARQTTGRTDKKALNKYPTPTWCVGFPTLAASAGRLAAAAPLAAAVDLSGEYLQLLPHRLSSSPRWAGAILNSMSGTLEESLAPLSLQDLSDLRDRLGAPVGGVLTPITDQQARKVFISAVKMLGGWAREEADLPPLADE